jgi:hypothetical protein
MISPMIIATTFPGGIASGSPSVVGESSRPP